MSAAHDSFYASLQKSCLPGVWSKGISLARSGSVRLDLDSAEELVFRIKVPERAVSYKVSFWPVEEDYFCDCEDRADPCHHVAAALAALKSRNFSSSESAGPKSGSALLVDYRFTRSAGKLYFERWVGNERFDESLIARVGGIDSGRVSGPRIDATQDDFAIDHVIGAGFPKLFAALKSTSRLSLEGRPVKIGTELRAYDIELRQEGDGREKAYRLILVDAAQLSAEGSELFSNGAILIGDELHAVIDPGLQSSEREALKAPGKKYAGRDLPRLFNEILPALESRLAVKVVGEAVPEKDQTPPKITLQLDRYTSNDGTERLGVTPQVEYASDFTPRDPALEKQLIRKLQSELQITLGHRIEFTEGAAVEFLERAKEWEMQKNAAHSYFTPESSVIPDFQDVESEAHFNFRTPSGKSVGAIEVVRAWRQNESFVRLLEGGFAPLPRDWLRRFGPRLQRLLDLKNRAGGKTPAFLKPEVLDFLRETGGSLSELAEKLRTAFEEHQGIRSSKLPNDLRAELRSYQRTGVDWLSFLRTAGVGGLLADDMGLGKTLQAICVFQGRTLIVCPTSVLSAWSEQIARFRPSLRVSLYYGANREFDPSSDVVLTSYGLLRTERERLVGEVFDTIVLDEAQTIKNPDSQVAKAAHSLRARFRIALSGTPVENRMEDLWSQFEFLNPGLLGTLSEFRETYASPISRGEKDASIRLTRIIRPFLLRRLKREVAPELPARTEVVLHAELSPSERELYSALLAASRNEVLAALDSGGSVFGALEQLLRLRQASSHPSLVPGEQASTSSKLELLVSTLSESIALGHRSLIFSQWTSFLDLIEMRLRSEGVSLLRLDGSTRDRASVVSAFQAPDGPSVMLISLKAGGTGLTLTAADHVFLMDSWWNPAVEDQAADRAHRIGQENPVLIHRLIAKDTVEEKVFALQRQKLELSSSVLIGSGKAASFTREDLTALLS